MKKTILFVVIILASVKVCSATKAYKIKGQLEKWNVLTIAFNGPEANAYDIEPGEPAAFDGQIGKFIVKAAEGNAPGIKKKGRLKYVGKHYYKFSDDGYWIKGGTDSPEDFLAYKGFTNTSFATHSYSSHLQHWNPGDPANDNLHYDIKMLQQWETVFSHAQDEGIFLHFVFNEAKELDGLTWVIHPPH